jgi:integrase
MSSSTSPGSVSRAAERTLDQYERDLRLVCFATSTGVENVTHGDLMLVLEVVPEKSWKRVRAAWGDFFKWSVREGRRLDNPVERLPKLRPTPEPVYDLWKQEELDLLVAATRKMESPLRERLRVLTMIESRAGELRGLQLGDFDLYRKTIVVTGQGLQATADPGLGRARGDRRRVHADRVPAARAHADRDGLPLVWRVPCRSGRHRLEARARTLLPRLLRVVEARRGHGPASGTASRT